jgi:hypothetical protein
MSNEVDPPNENETSTLSEQDIVFRLAAIGANNTNKSYDGRYKPLSDRFISLDLSLMANMWDFLEDHVKLRIINKHHDKFKTWINSHSTSKVDNNV